MLNESSASDRWSFVEQLENAFRTPARIDLRCSFPDNAMEIPLVTTMPIDIQNLSASAAGLSAAVDDFLTDDMGVSESHDAIFSDGKEYRRHLSFPVYSLSIGTVWERPSNAIPSLRPKISGHQIVSLTGASSSEVPPRLPRVWTTVVAKRSARHY